MNKINNVEIEKLRKSKASDDKVFDVLGKFKSNMENKMRNLDKTVMSKMNGILN